MATTLTRQHSLFHTHRLENGLQLIGQSIPGVESAASVFWVCTGTRDEERAHMGVSHFLEHMAFRGTDRMSGPEIDRAFEEMGAESNAGTSKEMTFYWARVLRENLPRAIEVLAELTHPLLEDSAFDQERNVILEEIARYEDQPAHVLMDHFMHDYFGQNPLSWEVLGTSETIKNLRVEDMRAYWHRRYGAANMIFSIAGNFDWDEVVEQVSSLSATWRSGETGRRFAPLELRPGLRVYQRDRFLQQHIAIGLPSVSSKDPRYWVAALLATVLGDNTGSRLYWALYQKGLADSATAQLMEFEDTGVILTHISTSPELAQQALSAALEELQRLQEGEVQEDELERAKAKLISAVIIGGESTNERVFGLISSWLAQGRLETLEETRLKIEAVTPGDIRELLDELAIAPEQVMTTTGPLAPQALRAR
ncbi:MAG TPA: pitrilysin family protein [Chloroflexota bacterium]|nr:pitrilysin family protein [Chloroflexota bacterium]